MEHLLKKSRVCLAGRFNAKPGLRPEELDELSSSWKRIKISKAEYDGLKSHYYPSLLQSMMEVDDEHKQSICRYEMILPEQCENLIVLEDKIYYPCEIKRVRIWFFPYDMILFSIDIEESPDSFSDLTQMHGKWKEWNKNYYSFHTDKLDNLLKPLAQLSPNTTPDPALLTFSGTKIRQYQVIETEIKKDEFETETIKDDLLYEIGTFSPIGVVKDSNACRSFKPATDYYKKIMNENTMSAYSNWKALALNDSFTVLAINEVYSESEFDEWNKEGKLIDTGYHYFELLYIRCLFEEYYCFDRNNLYREGHANSKEIENEIAYMEQHYFFDDMSYDFLPPLMYRAMAKGLDLQKDREQLTQHVKQALRDARQERNNRVVNFVQIFAIFSVVWTIHEMIIKICPCLDGAVFAIIFLVFAVFITFLLLKRPNI